MARSHISLLQQTHQTQKIQMSIKVAIIKILKSSNDAPLKKVWGGVGWVVGGKNKRKKKWCQIRAGIRD
jgi:hypothetical protein